MVVKREGKIALGRKISMKKTLNKLFCFLSTHKKNAHPELFNVRAFTDFKLDKVFLRCWRYPRPMMTEETRWDHCWFYFGEAKPATERKSENSRIRGQAQRAFESFLDFSWEENGWINVLNSERARMSRGDNVMGKEIRIFFPIACECHDECTIKIILQCWIEPKLFWFDILWTFSGVEKYRWLRDIVKNQFMTVNPNFVF